MKSQEKSDKPRAARMNKQQRAQLLLDTAIELFAQHGFDKAKHAELAAATGVSVATTFVYFPTREDLVYGVLNEVARFITEEVVEKGLSGDDEKNRLQHCAHVFMDKAVSHPNHIKVWLMWSTVFQPEIRQRYKQFESQFLATIASVLPQHEGGKISNLQRATLAVGAAMMLAQMILSDEPEESRQQYTRYVLDTLL